MGNSIILNKKPLSEINKFVAEHRVFYANNLADFLGCSLITAKRIIRRIKEKYGITSRVLLGEQLKQYVYEIG